MAFSRRTVSRGQILDPRTDSVTGYHDISPRVGAAYDVFGNGKTAVRVNLGHYLSSANNEGNFIINSPATTRQLTAARAWTDSNGNFVPDCDLLNFAAQTVPGGDVCNAVTGNSLNFGSTVRTTTVNPDVLSGWGKRPYDWVFGASVQQELIPRLSVEFAYSRRWWGNFFVTDNLNLGPENFDNLTIAAPANAEPARRRRVSRHLQAGERQSAVERLLHLRRRLRQGDAAVRQLRRHHAGAHDLGLDASGRHHDGPRGPRQLFDRGTTA